MACESVTSSPQGCAISSLWEQHVSLAAAVGVVETRPACRPQILDFRYSCQCVDDRVAAAVDRAFAVWARLYGRQRAAFTQAQRLRDAIALPRKTRARPVRRSHVMGLRLCGMALEPFWPLVNGSSASSTSVRCK